MRLLSIWSASLLLLPITAFADVASDFAALQTAFPKLPLLPVGETPITDTKAMIAGLAGNWVPLTMMEPGYKMPDAESFAQACERFFLRIEPVGDLGMTLVSGDEGNASITHLIYAGFGTFAGMPDEASLLKRLYGDHVSRVPEEKRLREIVRNRYMQDVILLPSGKDLLVMLFPRAPAEVWARCP